MWDSTDGDRPLDDRRRLPRHGERRAGFGDGAAERGGGAAQPRRHRAAGLVEIDLPVPVIPGIDPGQVLVGAARGRSPVEIEGGRARELDAAGAAGGIPAGSGSSTGAAVALWTGAPPKRVEVHAPRARTAHRVAARA